MAEACTSHSPTPISLLQGGTMTSCYASKPREATQKEGQAILRGRRRLLWKTHLSCPEGESGGNTSHGWGHKACSSTFLLSCLFLVGALLSLLSCHLSAHWEVCIRHGLCLCGLMVQRKETLVLTVTSALLELSCILCHHFAWPLFQALWRKSSVLGLSLLIPGCIWERGKISLFCGLLLSPPTWKEEQEEGFSSQFSRPSPSLKPYLISGQAFSLAPRHHFAISRAGGGKKSILIHLPLPGLWKLLLGLAPPAPRATTRRPHASPRRRKKRASRVLQA